MSEKQFNDFEEYWVQFLSEHRHPATRWMHVALVAVAAHGTLKAARKGSIRPLLKAAATASAMAGFSHRVLEGNKPERSGHPGWAARALGRLVFRTVTGSIKAEVENLPATV